VSQPGEVRLRIGFPAPGFFINDCRCIVVLDGMLVYDGSFMSGFVRDGMIAPGPHVLDAKIETPLFNRSKRYSFTIDSPSPGYRAAPEAWEVSLAYSRFWGNFESKLALRRVTS
jgi:hypothetical protein